MLSDLNKLSQVQACMSQDNACHFDVEVMLKLMPHPGVLRGGGVDQL